MTRSVLITYFTMAAEYALRGDLRPMRNVLRMLEFMQWPKPATPASRGTRSRPRQPRTHS